MRNRRSTITQEFSPKFRRRISIGKSNYLNVSMPHLIIADEDGISVCPSEINEQFYDNESSVSNSPARKQHQIRVEQYLSDFKFNHSRIHKIIDEVDQYMRKRMDIHETELINVVRKQIDGMMEDSRRVIEHYNRMLEQKNKQTEIYHLQNQLNYFKSASLTLFKENARIKQENKRALEKARDNELKVEELTYAMTKLTKKYLKSLANVDKNKSLSKKIENLKNNEEYYIRKYRNQKNSKQQQFLTEIESKIEEEPSCIVIDVDDKSDVQEKSNLEKEFQDQMLNKQISKEENQTEVYTQEKSYHFLRPPKFSKYSKTPRPILYSRQERVSFSKLASPVIKDAQFLKTKKRIFSANKKKTATNLQKDRRKTEVDPNKSEKSLGTALSFNDKNYQSNTKMEMKLNGAAIKLQSKNVGESIVEGVEKKKKSRNSRVENFWKIKQYNASYQGKEG